jgi:uncharacterized protein YdeI (BOF family)
MFLYARGRVVSKPKASQSACVSALSALALCAAVLLVGGPLAHAETVCEVQAYDPATGLSLIGGRGVTVTGIVTVPSGIFQPTQTSIYIRGTGADKCGVNVYSRTQVTNIDLGDTLTVRGAVQDYISARGNGAITEIAFTAVGDLTLKKGTGPVEPEVMTTGAAAQESSEGKLVRVTGNLDSSVSGRSFEINDGSGMIEIYDFGQHFASDLVWKDLEYGDQVTVTGVVSQSDGDSPYLSGYSINPRHPQFGDLKVPQCIPGDAARAWLQVGRDSTYIFSPEHGEEMTIAYDCPNGARLRLRVFDCYGRCVANLDDRISVCGRTEIGWDGRDELKQQLPAGLYHIVVTATDAATGVESQETLPVVIGRRLK